MNSVKIVLLAIILTLTLTLPGMATSEKEKDFAVPAFSDLPLLGAQNTTAQMVGPKALGPLPYTGQLQWLDINRDLQLNDFDVKQFQTVIQNLRGEKLTGLQLVIQFREQQKNQKESFPIAYDLDRDGMFTTYDVDSFSQVINKLDQGSTRGSELIQKFRQRIFPQSNK